MRQTFKIPSMAHGNSYGVTVHSTMRGFPLPISVMGL